MMFFFKFRGGLELDTSIRTFNQFTDLILRVNSLELDINKALHR